MGQELTNEKGVMSAEATGEGLAQRGQLPAQLAAGQIGEDRRICRPRDQGVEHGATGGAEQAGGDGRELDTGIFEHFVQAGWGGGGVVYVESCGAGGGAAVSHWGGRG